MTEFGLAEGEDRLIFKLVQDQLIIQIWNKDTHCSIKLSDFQVKSILKELIKNAR